MRILETVEEGLVPLDPDELTLDGDTWMRRDVLARGYVEWRAAAPETGARRDDESVVAVQRSLYARGVVGLLPLSKGLAVLVRPKFPASITAMVEACEWPPVPISVLREYQPSGSASDWMLTRLVHEYLGAVEVLLDQGLMRNYVRRRTITSSPKGRLLSGTTMSMLSVRGIDYKVASEHFERTEENPPNQAIMEALRWSRAWSEKQRKMGDHKRAGRPSTPSRACRATRTVVSSAMPTCVDCANCRRAGLRTAVRWRWLSLSWNDGGSPWMLPRERWASRPYW